MDHQTAQRLLKKVERDYERIASAFDEKRQTTFGVLPILAQEVHDGSRVLDIGCGNGRFFELLRGRSIRYVGVDQNATLLERARERYGNFPPNEQPTFQKANALTLPFPDSSFDSVFLLAVLHHIPSIPFRQQVLLEAARVLKSGGKLIMMNWNLYAYRWWRRYRWRLLPLLFPFPPYDRGDCFIPWKEGIEKADRYVHAFFPFEIRRLLRTAGLTCASLRYDHHGKRAHWLTGETLVTIARK